MSLVSNIIQNQVAKGRIVRQEAQQSMQQYRGVRGLGETPSNSSNVDNVDVNDVGELKTTLKAETTVGVISRKLARVGTTYGISRAVMGSEAKSYQDYGYGATSGWGTAIASSIVGTATNIGMFWGVEQSVGSPFVDEKESATIADLFSNSIVE